MQCAWIRLSCFFARGGEGLNLCFFFAGRDAKYAILKALFCLRGLLLRHVGLYIFKVFTKKSRIRCSNTVGDKISSRMPFGGVYEKNEAFLIDLYLGVTSHLYPSDVSWTSLRRLWDVHVTSRWNSCEIPAQPLRPPCDRRATAERPPRYAEIRRRPPRFLRRLSRKLQSKRLFSVYRVYIM